MVDLEAKQQVRLGDCAGRFSACIQLVDCQCTGFSISSVLVQVSFVVLLGLGEHGYSEEKNELFFFSNTTNRVPSKWKLDTHKADTPIRDKNDTQIRTKRRLSYVPNPQQDDKWYLD